MYRFVETLLFKNKSTLIGTRLKNMNYSLYQVRPLDVKNKNINKTDIECQQVSFSYSKRHEPIDLN